MPKLLLLDLDGTVRFNKARPGDYINVPDEIELYPEALQAMRDYAADGWTIVGISNQGGIERGFTTLNQCIEGMRRTIELSEDLIQVVLFCPDAYPKMGSSCHAITKMVNYAPDGFRSSVLLELSVIGYRKPCHGMILAAKWWFGPSDMWEQVLMVGDRPEDELAAHNAGVPFMWAHHWRESHKMAHVCEH